MDGMLISGKRDFNYDEEEKAFLGFMCMIFVVCALVFLWGVYAHWNQTDLIKTGKTALATVSPGGQRVNYVAEDGVRYSVDITGMFLDDFEETVMVYYKENPADAVPLTSIKFFLFVYGIAIVGMSFSLFFIRRTRKSIEKSKPVL